MHRKSKHINYSNPKYDLISRNNANQNQSSYKNSLIHNIDTFHDKINYNNQTLNNYYKDYSSTNPFPQMNLNPLSSNFPYTSQNNLIPFGSHDEYYSGYQNQRLSPTIKNSLNKNFNVINNLNKNFNSFSLNSQIPNSNLISNMSMQRTISPTRSLLKTIYPIGILKLNYEIKHRKKEFLKKCIEYDPGFSSYVDKDDFREILDRFTCYPNMEEKQAIFNVFTVDNSYINYIDVSSLSIFEEIQYSDPFLIHLNEKVNIPRASLINSITKNKNIDISPINEVNKKISEENFKITICKKVMEFIVINSHKIEADEYFDKLFSDLDFDSDSCFTIGELMNFFILCKVIIPDHELRYLFEKIGHEKGRIQKKKLKLFFYHLYQKTLSKPANTDFARGDNVKYEILTKEERNEENKIMQIMNENEFILQIIDSIFILGKPFLIKYFSKYYILEHNKFMIDTGMLFKNKSSIILIDSNILNTFFFNYFKRLKIKFILVWLELGYKKLNYREIPSEDVGKFKYFCVLKNIGCFKDKMAVYVDIEYLIEFVSKYFLLEKKITKKNSMQTIEGISSRILKDLSKLLISYGHTKPSKLERQVKYLKVRSHTQNDNKKKSRSMEKSHSYNNSKSPSKKKSKDNEKNQFIIVCENCKSMQNNPFKDNEHYISKEKSSFGEYEKIKTNEKSHFNENDKRKSKEKNNLSENDKKEKKEYKNKVEEIKHLQKQNETYKLKLEKYDIKSLINETHFRRAFINHFGFVDHFNIDHMINQLIFGEKLFDRQQKAEFISASYDNYNSNFEININEIKNPNFFHNFVLNLIPHPSIYGNYNINPNLINHYNFSKINPNFYNLNTQHLYANYNLNPTLINNNTYDNINPNIYGNNPNANENNTNYNILNQNKFDNSNINPNLINNNSYDFNNPDLNILNQMNFFNTNSNSNIKNNNPNPNSDPNIIKMNLQSFFNNPKEFLEKAYLNSYYNINNYNNAEKNENKKDLENSNNTKITLENNLETKDNDKDSKNKEFLNQKENSKSENIIENKLTEEKEKIKEENNKDKKVKSPENQKNSEEKPFKIRNINNTNWIGLGFNLIFMSLIKFHDQVGLLLDENDKAALKNVYANLEKRIFPKERLSQKITLDVNHLGNTIVYQEDTEKLDNIFDIKSNTFEKMEKLKNDYLIGSKYVLDQSNNDLNIENLNKMKKKRKEYNLLKKEKEKINKISDENFHKDNLFAGFIVQNLSTNNNISNSHSLFSDKINQLKSDSEINYNFNLNVHLPMNDKVQLATSADSAEVIPELYKFCTNYLMLQFNLEKVDFNVLRSIGVCKVFREHLKEKKVDARSEINYLTLISKFKEFVSENVYKFLEYFGSKYKNRNNLISIQYFFAKLEEALLQYSKIENI